ncbi:Spy/CpxP family protein refolding chaperone [Bdellovibrio bacteriovorus]|uniref:Spy/CpxP family protein refolding chaperone n=1 Tax=Bdellovibrio bacteriovorus TaxID=959 RepID=UPI003D05589D
MKFNLVLAGALVATMMSTNAWARSGGRDHHKNDEIALENHFSPKKMKELNLTEEQKEKLKAIREAAKAEKQKCREDMRTARKAFKEALRSNASKEAVTAAYQSMLEKKQQLSQARLDTLLSARDVLTEEQRAKLFSHGSQGSEE